MTHARAVLTGLLLHCALAIFYTWPLVLNLGNGVTPGTIVEDRDQNLWNLWWVKTALIDQHSLDIFHTDWMYWPTGVSLQFHTLNAFNGLISIPFQPFFTLPTIYDGIVLLSFILTGWGAFLCLRWLLARPPIGPLSGPALWAAAAVGSSIFAYSAYHLATQRGLLQLISLEWVPFAVWALLRAVHDGPAWTDRRAAGQWIVRRALPAAGFLLLVALVDWYYVMYTLLFAGLYGLYLVGRALLQHDRTATTPLTRLRPLEPGLRLAIPVGLFLVAAAPLLVPMFDELQQTGYMRPAPGVAVENSADLVAFFAPTRVSQLWGRLSAFRLTWPFGGNAYEVYLGYITLALAAVGLRIADRGLRNINAVEVPDTKHETRNTQHATDIPQSAIPLPSRWFWAGAVAVFFLLALGPVLQVNGVQHAGVQPMPYTLIEKIPGLNISRSPDRFAMPLMLCLSVLAAGGVGVLAGRLGNRPAASAVLTGALLVGQAVELWPVPFPQLPAPVPAFYGQLAADPDDYAILELPREDAYWHGAIRMYFQTAHHKRIFYGYISREYYHPFLDSTPGFMELQNPDGLGDVLGVGPDQWLSALADYKTRYVALYKKGWRPETPADDTAQYRAELAQVIGAAAVAAPAHSDADLDLYRVPLPDHQVPYLALGDGWGRREATAQEAHRWIRNDANLDLHNPTSAHLQLVFQANTLRDPRLLKVTLAVGGAAAISQADLNLDAALREYRVDLGTVPAGQARILLSSPGAVQSPRNLGMNDDPRPLGVFFTNVRVETVP